MSKNNVVFVREYTCPIKDKRIKKIYEKNVKLTGSSPTQRKRQEKLYMILSISFCKRMNFLNLNINESNRNVSNDIG